MGLAALRRCIIAIGPFGGCSGRVLQEAFQQERITGAKFLNIDDISDSSFSSTPHNLPDDATFNQLMGQLGICKSTIVVLYDCFGIFSSVSYSPRSWGLSLCVTSPAVGSPSMHSGIIRLQW